MKLIFLPLLSAILLTLSSPGLDLWWLSFISFIPILFSLKDKKYFFTKTLIFSTTYYFFNLFWINSSVSHFGGAPLIIGILAVFGLSLYMSIYLLLFFYLNLKTDKIVISALVFVVIEILRSKIFTGFPWLNLGLIPYNSQIFTNFYSIFGEYGVSLIIILVNLSLYKVLSQKNTKQLIPTGIVILLLITSNVIKPEIKYNKSLNISIIQPAYKQEEKWLPEKREEIKNLVISMIEIASKSKSDLILLPESVFPFFIQADNLTFGYITESSLKKDLLLGNIRYDQKLNYYNSAFFFSKGSYQYYDKMHLVPFGEYFPLKIITAPISRYFFGDAKDFSRGKVHKVFNSNNINILPLICYESAFYDIIFNAFKDKSPDMLVILSNDSWFGDTLGRVQHLAIDIVRAKEFMRPVIRVTQSGISAYINEKGEIINKIGNNKQDIIEANVNIDSNKRSLFSKYGYLWLGIYALISLIFSVKRERY